MQTDTNFRIENGKPVYYKFECNHCGQCCLFLDVILTKADILNWIQRRRTDLLQYIQIQSESISPENLLISEIEGKLDQLRSFILTNHDYCGENWGLEEDSIVIFHKYLPKMGDKSILRPHSFEIILNGFELGLKYILRWETDGYCVFFKENQCVIHEIKPQICKQFPFETDGKLALNEWTLNVCKGIQKIP